MIGIVACSKPETTEFREALLALLQKFGVTIEACSEYDGNDTCCGTEYIFQGAWNKETEEWDIWLNLREIAVEW